MNKNRHRKRIGNTLVELVIYIALTIVITVGLANVLARIRTAQFTTDIKSEVQQTVRTTTTQLTALGKTYDQAYCPTNGNCADSAEVHLWNTSENLTTTGGPTTYLKLWLDSTNHALIAQHFADGAPSSSELRLTPTTVNLKEFKVKTVEGQTKNPSLSLQIVITDATVASSAAPRDSLSIMTSVPLRPQNVPLADICCPRYLAASCAADIPRCLDGCFADGQAAAGTQAENIPNPQGIALDPVRHRLFVSSVENEISKVIVLELDENNAFKAQSERTELGAPADSADQKLSQPHGLAYDSVHDRLFVADTNNNRVMIYDTRFIEANESAIRVLGQQGFQSVNSASAGASGLHGPRGVAYDPANDHLYVADTGNNRVLRFDVTAVTNGEEADMAFGTASPQDGNTAAGTSNTKLRGPTSVTLDTATKLLFVGDGGNNRIVTFKLTDNPPPHIADDVFGQASFIANAGGTTATTLNAPDGIAFDTMSHRLLVADEQNNRVAVFGAASTIPPSVTTARTMDSVLGQADKTTAAISDAQTGMHGPRGIAFDRVSQLLYVADTGNNRVLSFQGGSSPVCGGGPDLSIIKPIPPPISTASVASSSTATLSCSATNADGPLFANINDNMNGSPPDNQDFIQACGINDAVYFRLSAVPGNFGSAKSVKYRIVRRVNPDTAGRFSIFGVELYHSNKTSKLATGPIYSYIGPAQVDIPPNQTWVTEEFTVNQAGITGQNDKAGWNDALLKIESLDASSYVQISAAEVEVEYFVEGSTTTTATALLHVDGDAGGKLASVPASSNSSGQSSSASSAGMTMSLWRRSGTLTSPNLVANWPMEKSADINVISETHGYNGTLPRDETTQQYETERSRGAYPYFPWVPAVRPFQWQTGDWMLDFSSGLAQFPASVMTLPDAEGYRFDIDAPFAISLVDRYFLQFGTRLSLFKKMTGAPAQGFAIFRKRGGTTTYQYCFEVRSQPNNRTIAYTSEVQQIGMDRFNHLVVSFDPLKSVSNRVKIYVNGVEQNTTLVLTCEDTVPPPAGQEYGTTAATVGVPIILGPLSGNLDDLRIYDKAMEPWEVD